MSQSSSQRPAPFSAYTTPEFWSDPHISAQMLSFHLDASTPLSSRPHAFIDRSAEWIVRRFGLGPGSRVLDLGCGPGLYALRFARVGASVTGVDVSARSVDYARDAAAAEGLSIATIHGSYLEVDLGGPYELAVLIYEDYCTLSPGQRRLLLMRTHAALRPGGAILVDYSAAPRFDEQREGSVTEAHPAGGFFAAAPHTETRATWLYPEARLQLDHYVVTEEARVREFYNWFQYLTPEEAAAELVEAGFVAVEVLGDVAGAPYDPESGTFAMVAVSAGRGRSDAVR